MYSCDDLLTLKCLKEHGMDGCISLYYLSRNNRSFLWYLGVLLAAGKRRGQPVFHINNPEAHRPFTSGNCSALMAPLHFTDCPIDQVCCMELISALAANNHIEVVPAAYNV